MRVLFSKGIAFIARPRCGSTSIRRMLSPLVNIETGDIAVDVAGESSPYHPHITAPYLQEILHDRFHGHGDLDFFTTVRNPIDMLFSYYKYFKPDTNSRYNYEPGWLGEIGLTFEQWIIKGRVGSNPNWLRLGPSNISMNNISPLSLEAHVINHEGQLMVDKLFKIEEPKELISWLTEKAGENIDILHVNQSQSSGRPTISDEAMTRIRDLFPMESEIYKI